ncbi:hypothetical protein H0H81_010385 [Sphagnurus paluster]|uniref:BHLH domain-containing protein n=1 Tax=Sphagnurus paluster TaxID=117069 RepID=A0A9P7FYP2_9AGAR|nr:hypothetical protein H0H81_010385 [Sphagnurus paluster]
MSSFFSSSSSASYKPQPHIRQEGFHPDNSGNSFDLFNNSFAPDPYRKFPSGPSASMDFGDELVSLMHHDRSPSADDRYQRPTHNIFDISAPNGTATADYPAHFNQTLPALNSSLRYENDNNATAPPSSYHPPAQHFTRHTPSPISISSSHPNPSVHSRSRSRSRPPSSTGVAPPSATANNPNPNPNGIGPARTSRTRRNNSISSTSPPPGRPHAIVIPRSRAATVSNTNTNSGWFMASHSNTTASEYSLPTPDSLHSLSSPHMAHAHVGSPPHPLSSSPTSTPSQATHTHTQYTPFSLSPPPEHHHSHGHGLHLPPVSSIHMHPSNHGHHSQSYMHAHIASSPHSLPNIHTNLAITAIPADRSPPHQNGNGNASANANGVDKQTLLANEKRRRRRESHNAVERRRRDNINEKISELATLIPECLLDVGAPSSSTSNPQPNTTNGNGNSGSPKTPEDPSPASPLDAWKKDPERASPDAHPNSSSNSASNGNGNGNGSGNGNGNGNGEGLGVVKANKGMILRKSVEYIRYLQQLVEAQGARNRELEAELKVWRAGGAPEPQAQSHSQSQGQMGMYGGGYVGGAGFFGLPSMPEGEGEDGEGDGEDEGVDDMDVESVVDKRGRTRGVSGVGSGKKVRKGALGGGGGGGGGKVKEEGGPGEEMMVL